MADVFQQRFLESQNKKDPFQRMAEATQRNSAKIQAFTLSDEIQSPDVNVYDSIQQGKSVGDHLQDLAVTGVKAAVAVPQIVVGLADLVDYGMSKATQGYQEIGAALGLNARPDYEIQTGRIGNFLEENTWLKFKEAQQALDSLKSEESQRQQREYQQLAGLSTDKSLSDNWEAFKGIVDYAVDNPSLPVLATVESLPSMFMGGLLGRGAGAGISALGGRAIAQAGLGEGLAMAGAQQESIRSQTSGGLTTPEQSNLALVTGGIGGLVGAAGGGIATSRIGKKLGLSDIETSIVQRQAGEDLLTQAANRSALTKAAGSVVLNSAEEFVQTIPESINENVALDRPLLDQVGQNVVLATMAGGLTSAGMTTLGSVPNAVNKVVDKAQQLSDKAKENITQTSYEDLSNPTHEKYNPAAAYNSQLKFLDSDNQDLRQQAEANISKITEDILTNLETVKGDFAEAYYKLEQAQQLGDTDLIASAQQSYDLAVAEYQRLNQQYLDLEDAKQKYETNKNTGTTSDVIKSNVATLTQDNPDTTGQQDAVEHVKNFMSQYDSDDLLKLAENSIYFTPEQKDSLRQLAEVKVLQNQNKGTSQVANDVIFGLKGNTKRESHRGLKDYEKLVERGVRVQDNQLIESSLTNLETWATSHNNKANVLTQAYDMVKDTNQVVQVVPVSNGQWKINTDRSTFLSPKERKAAGAIEVHRNSNSTRNTPIGFIDQVQQEAELISITYTALNSYVSSFSQNSDLATTNSINTPQVQAEVTPTEVDANDSVEETIVPPSVAPTQTSTPEMVEPYQAVLTQNGMSVEVAVLSKPTMDTDGKEIVVIEIDGKRYKAYTSNVKPVEVTTENSNDMMIATDVSSNNEDGMSSPSTQETPHVDEIGENVQGTNIANESNEAVNLNSLPTQGQMILFESGDEIKRTHSIPASLVNQPKSLKDAHQELSAMTTEDSDNSYGLELLNRLQQAIPDVQINLVDDISTVPDKKIQQMLSAGGVYTPDNNTVNIYPNGDVWTGNATDLVNHELVHAVTVSAIDEGLTDEQIQDLETIRDSIKEVLFDKYDQFDEVIVERLDYATTQDFPHELISVLVSESDVRAALTDVIDLSKIDSIFNSILNSHREIYNDANNEPTARSSTITSVPESVSKSSKGTAGGVQTPTRTTQTSPESVSTISDSQSNSGSIREDTRKSRSNEDTIPKPTGIVTALQGITKALRIQERSKPFKERNLITAHFNQSVGTNNPLVLVSNFVETLKDNLKETVQKFVKNPVTKTQEKQLQDYLDFHKEVSSTIKQIFQVKPEPYRYRDYTSFLVNADNQLDENTLTALTLAAYSTFIETGLKTLNTNAEIAELLHLDEDTYIPNAVANQYRDVGQQRSVVIHALGKKAAQFLGLKVRRDSDPKFQSSLEGSLGGLIYMALRTQGLVQETVVPGKQHAANMSLIHNANGKEYAEPKELGFEYAYARIALENGEVIPRIKDIIEKNKDTKGFLSKLFGNDVGLREPKLEQPKTFDQTTISRTSSTVSSAQAKYIEQSQKNGFKIRTAVAQVMQGLFNQNKDYLLSLLGIAVTPEVLDSMHRSQRKNFEAKAENEQRALTNAFTFINGLEFKDGEYQTFWDTQYISANNRMYYNSNLFNVQTQQIHRALAGLEGFKTTFDPNQSSMTEDGDVTEYGKFLLGIAENMEGIENNKLFQEQLPTYTYRTVDKVASKDFLPAFEAYLNQDYVQAAISAMSDLINLEQQNVGNAPANMPESLLNKLVQVKDVKSDLFKVSSGKLNQADRKHLNDLLNVFMQLDDSIYIGLYDDLSKIENTQVRKSVKGGAIQHNSTQGEMTIYIDLNNKEQADVFEILVHEYHHAVAHTALIEELKTNDKLINIFENIRAAIRGFGENNESIDPYVQSRLQYMYNAASLYSYSEILTVGTVEPSVIEVLQQIPFKEGSKHSLYDMVLNISHEMMRKQNPSKYTKHVEDAFNDLEQNRRTDNQGSVEERAQLAESGGVSGATELQDSGRDQQGTGQEPQKKSTKGSRRYSTVLNAEARKAIQDFVNESGMGVQSLYALISLAEHRNAVQNGDTKFTTYIGLGSDGVNNGVAIANVLTGLANPNMRMQVGLIPVSENQDLKTYFDTKEQGIPDYYVEFAAVINNHWQNLKSSLDSKKTQALEALFSSWGKRKMAKVWAVPFNYNAGFTRLKSVMADQFITDIYAQMTKIANLAKQADRQSIEYQNAVNLRNALEANLSVVLGQKIYLPNPEQLNDWDFGMDSIVKTVI